jgi:hypothetical protein
MMHSLENELRELHRDGVIDDATAARAIALENGTLFSVASELRIVLYSGVAAITGGLGLILKNNLDRIGPLAVTLGIAALGAACYVFAARSKRQAGALSVGADYVLLLGALVVSADLAYAESQFHWFGDSWSWEVLALAALHAVTAYVFESVLLLSLALTSLAAWFGIGLHPASLLDSVAAPGRRAVECAAVMLVWSEIHRRAHGSSRLQKVLEQFALNVAFWGAVFLSGAETTRFWGAALALLLGAACIAVGMRKRREVLLVYGVIYAALVICILINQAIDALAPRLAVMLLTVLGAAALLTYLHSRIKEHP